MRELHSVLAVEPDDIDALTTLGFVLIADGQPERAVPVLENVRRLTNGCPAATAVLIRAEARSGRRADALRLLDQLRQRRDSGYVPAPALRNKKPPALSRGLLLMRQGAAYRLTWIVVPPPGAPVPPSPLETTLTQSASLSLKYEVSLALRSASRLLS